MTQRLGVLWWQVAQAEGAMSPAPYLPGGAKVWCVTFYNRRRGAVAFNGLRLNLSRSAAGGAGEERANEPAAAGRGCDLTTLPAVAIVCMAGKHAAVGRQFASKSTGRGAEPTIDRLDDDWLVRCVGGEGGCWQRAPCVVHNLQEKVM